MRESKWLQLSDAMKPQRKLLVDASDIVCLSDTPDIGTEVWSRSGVPMIVKESIGDIRQAMGIFPVEVGKKEGA